MIFKNIIDSIGHTPLIKLNKLSEATNNNIYAKLEYYNPGKSIKDRIALSMIRQAEKEGKLTKGNLIVEPTSGNTGIGLVLIGKTLGYDVLLTMPESMTLERRKIITYLGGNIVLTDTALGMKGSIDKAKEIEAENKKAFMPNQFTNPANPQAHKKTTALEILNDIDKIDYFVAGIGTGGTITGVGEILKEKNNKTQIIGLEPETSAVLSGKNPGQHKIQGIGAGFIPSILNINILDQILTISNEDAFIERDLIAKTEGLFVGISSGAAIAGVRKIAENTKNKTIITIFPDSGEKYLSI